MTAPNVRDYPSALDFLLHRINYERTTNIPYSSSAFKLDRMRRLLSLLGDPHLAVPAVHIAGTKGKGSTAAMIAAVLQAAGYRTGLYTSPHLARIEERIAIDGLMCSESEFVALTAELQAAIEKLTAEAAATDAAADPTFFEITTAMAFLHFARSQVDLAVLEVGLGGRLDSTNVCLPEVCVITSISYDHTRQLGNTLTAIAAEKAGIIKPGIPVVSGVVDPEPREVIAGHAAECGAPLIQRGVDFGERVSQGTEFGVQGSGGRGGWSESEASPAETFDFWEKAYGEEHSLPGIRLAMLGAHQAANAATALAAINVLKTRGWSISEDAIRTGLSQARRPGRIEQVASAPAVIFDVAHNLASVAALLPVLRERFTAQRRILIFASSKDKDYEGMLRLLVPAFDVVFVTKYIENPRAAEVESLVSIAQQLRNGSSSAPPRQKPILHATARPADAWSLARRLASPGDLLCVTGSFFLVAELRPLALSS